MLVNTIANPSRSAAAITSTSLIEPPASLGALALNNEVTRIGLE
ncbi:MAG: hypothetical protein WAN12_17780 [Candidatus Acidiferrum sp.]